MKTSRSPHPAWPRAARSALSRWRHSLFWTIVPAMFLASCIGAAVMVVGATILEDRRLRAALVPEELRRSLGQALPTAVPLLTAQGSPAAWCVDTLRLLAERVLAEGIRDRTGDVNANGFQRATQAGRIAVVLYGAGGTSCRFGSGEMPTRQALQQQMALAGDRHGTMSEQPDGWISTVAARVPGPGAPVIVAGVYILSPWAKLMQPRSIMLPLAVFILGINLVAALVLVILLIRRIARADHAATAWTLGKLDARIHDPGRDELSRLTRRFDIMADAMAGVIQVKQALAAAEERNRLARDLHDSAKQRAFALNLQLSAAQETMPPDASGARLVEAALTLTNQLQQDLASVIQRLAAPTIAESGFRTMLTEAIDAMLTGSGIAWSLSLDAGDEAVLGATPEVPHQLFLITVEAVANLLKHAGATRCAVSGERSGTLYAWRISDNGGGRRPAASSPKGMGLASMKLRAAGLPGGAFDILSGNDGGTVVIVTFLTAMDPE